MSPNIESASDAPSAQCALSAPCAPSASPTQIQQAQVQAQIQSEFRTHRQVRPYQSYLNGHTLIIAAMVCGFSIALFLRKSKSN